jgi:large subunit ribosomal protein L9
MEVILKEDVTKLGARGDVVKVADGYGRNYLLPKKLAIEATLANKKVIEQMKAAAVRRSAREKSDAEALAKQFDGVLLTFTRRAGEHDQLFGSVTSADIAEALQKKGFNVERRRIWLEAPLKNIGSFTVSLHLHKEVNAPIQVVIEKEAVAEEKAPAGEGGEAETPES